MRQKPQKWRFSQMAGFFVGLKIRHFRGLTVYVRSNERNSMPFTWKELKFGLI